MYFWLYSVVFFPTPGLTSNVGFNSYLIIDDRVTRYTWIFLTTSKALPINIAQQVLNKFKSNNLHKTVQTDQGGELVRSSLFRTRLDKEIFTLNTTGADASVQNGIAKKLKQNFRQYDEVYSA